MERNRGVIGNIAQRPFAFLATFAVLFLLTYAFLAVTDALPEPRGQIEVSQEPAVPQQLEAPVQVEAPTIGMKVSVENPPSTNLAVLDDALLRGAVRYPTSAQLGEEGTVFIFGHSSYLPVVYNQAYKAFNKIQDLKTGEIVSVYSTTHEYRYAVVGVRLADATEDVIELPQTGRQLVLVTCDSFTSKSSRFVVTADFIGAYAL